MAVCPAVPVLLAPAREDKLMSPAHTDPHSPSLTSVPCDPRSTLEIDGCDYHGIVTLTTGPVRSVRQDRTGQRARSSSDGAVHYDGENETRDRIGRTVGIACDAAVHCYIIHHS